MCMCYKNVNMYSLAYFLYAYNGNMDDIFTTIFVQVQGAFVCAEFCPLKSYWKYKKIKGELNSRESFLGQMSPWTKEPETIVKQRHIIIKQSLSSPLTCFRRAKFL